MAEEIKVKIIGDNSQLKREMKDTESSVKKSASNMATAMKGIAFGVVGLAALKLAKDAITLRGEMERLTAQFTPLLGSTSEAKKRMKELSDFAAKTPFKLNGIANASRTLETLTGGALSTGDGLRLVGDAAAQTGSDFAELSVHVGRAYSSLQSNRAAGESLARMQELGLLTGEARNKIEDLQKQMKGREAWAILQEELGKASGGMEILSNTFEGKISTLSDNWDEFLRNMVTSDSWASMKGAIDLITDSLKEWNSFLTETGPVITNQTKKIQELAKTKMDLARTDQALNRIRKQEETFYKGQPKLFKERMQFLNEEKLRTNGKINDIKEELRLEKEKIALENEKIENDKNKKEPKAPKGSGSTGGGGEALPPEWQVKFDAEMAFEQLQSDNDDLYYERASKRADELQTQADNEKQIREAAEREKKELIDQSTQHQLDSEEAIARTKRRNEKILRDARIADINTVMGITGQTFALMKAMGKKGKAIARTEAVIQGGLAMQKAVALGFPQNIPAIALTGLQVATNIATIENQKFAQGGIVGGNSFQGDKVPIQANSGEMVLNNDQQKSLFNMLNGGGGQAPSINVTIGSISDENKSEVLQKFAEITREAYRGGYITQSELN